MKKLFFLIFILLLTSITSADSFKQDKEYTCKVMRFIGSDGEYIVRNKNNTDRMNYTGLLSFKYDPGSMKVNGVVKTGPDANRIYFDHKFTYNTSNKTLDTYLDFKYGMPLYFSNETTEVHVIYPSYHSILECIIE